MTTGYRQYVATFGREADILGATAAARAHGLEVVDVYTPYAVHGLDKAMGLKQSRLTWACFAFAMAGGLLALWFQYWTSAIDWDLNVGGKPFNSLPAFTPVLFELMVLFGGLGVVGTFFVVARLYPGKRGRPIVPGVTNDKFALVCEDRTAYLPPPQIHELLEQFNALAIDEHVGREEVGGMGLTRLDWVLAAGVVCALGASLVVQPDLTVPNYEFMPDMARGADYSAYEANPHFADGKTLQRQQPGTIARGQQPLHYAKTPEGAAQAGRELRSPYVEADAATLHSVRERGAQVWSSFCVACHGGGGAGDGAVAKRGFPPPPSLLAPHAREMADGQMFHAVTFGQGNMPAHDFLVTPADRWRVIAYIRQMQEDADGE